MAMETALLNYTVPQVIQLIKEMLTKQGYKIEQIDQERTIVLAYRDGKWFRSPWHVLFQISSIDNSFTRVDVTATIESRKKSKTDEEILEEEIVSNIYEYVH